jgi:hypothetical protein
LAAGILPSDHAELFAHPLVVSAINDRREIEQIALKNGEQDTGDEVRSERDKQNPDGFSLPVGFRCHCF